MNGFKLSTPVAFFIFNRPDTTAKVFEQIRAAKPPKLLVIADGPRADRPEEAEKCALTREIIDGVDWDCQVMTNYANINAGCKLRMSTGLNWVFATVESAIILEHDTLPHPTFFRFCEELLERYLADERIMMISGCNFQFGARRTDYSYYFSRYVHCWGWATWRRAWQHYDITMARWPELRNGSWLRDILHHDTGELYWRTVFDATYQGYVNTWDYQWVMTCWLQNGVNILPNTNLIANIGFGAGATHTGNSGSRVANLATDAMEFPLKHPPAMIFDRAADILTQELYNSGEM